VDGFLPRWPVPGAQNFGSLVFVEACERGGNMAKDSTMTKADLVEELLRVTELPRKESETVVETIFDSIIQALQGGDKIEIRGFGSFRTRSRRGRVGRNPKTGEKVEVPSKKILFFKPSKELKDFVNSEAAARAASGASDGSAGTPPSKS